MSIVPSASGSGSAARPSPLGDPGFWGRGAGACELPSFRPGVGPSRSSMSGEAVPAGSEPVDRLSGVDSFNSGCPVSPHPDAGPLEPSARRKTRTRRPIKRTGTARSGPLRRFRKLRKDIVEPEENHARDPRLGRDFRGQMIRVIAGTIVAYQVARSISGPETVASDNGTLSLRRCGGALHTDSAPGAGRSAIGSGPEERRDTGLSAPRPLPLRRTERSYRMMPGARSAHPATSDKRCYVKK